MNLVIFRFICYMLQNFKTEIYNKVAAAVLDSVVAQKLLLGSNVIQAFDQSFS